jgi:hypothetical protein
MHSQRGCLCCRLLPVQWFVLSKPHAVLAVADVHVREMLHRCDCRCCAACGNEILIIRLHQNQIIMRSRVVTASGAANPLAQQPSWWLCCRYCYSNLTRNYPTCVSDEHWLPSLLASYGLEDQTDCEVCRRRQTTAVLVACHQEHLGRLVCCTDREGFRLPGLV